MKIRARSNQNIKHAGGRSGHDVTMFANNAWKYLYDLSVKREEFNKQHGEVKIICKDGKYV